MMAPTLRGARGPAPKNLLVPTYAFLDGDRVGIGRAA